MNNFGNCTWTLKAEGLGLALGLALGETLGLTEGEELFQLVGNNRPRVPL